MQRITISGLKSGLSSFEFQSGFDLLGECQDVAVGVKTIGGAMSPVTRLKTAEFDSARLDSALMISEGLPNKQVYFGTRNARTVGWIRERLAQKSFDTCFGHQPQDSVFCQGKLSHAGNIQRRFTA